MRSQPRHRYGGRGSQPQPSATSPVSRCQPRPPTLASALPPRTCARCTARSLPSRQGTSHRPYPRVRRARPSVLHGDPAPRPDRARRPARPPPRLPRQARPQPVRRHPRGAPAGRIRARLTRCRPARLTDSHRSHDGTATLQPTYSVSTQPAPSEPRKCRNLIHRGKLAALMPSSAEGEHACKGSWAATCRRRESLAARSQGDVQAWEGHRRKAPKSCLLLQKG